MGSEEIYGLTSDAQSSLRTAALSVFNQVVKLGHPDSQALCKARGSLAIYHLKVPMLYNFSCSYIKTKFFICLCKVAGMFCVRHLECQMEI